MATTRATRRGGGGRGRRLNIGLNSNSMEQLDKVLGKVVSDFKREISDRRVSELATRIDANFRALIRDNITGPRYATGDIENSVRVTYTSSNEGKYKFRINVSNSSPDFKYFEYGTGIVGAWSDSSGYDDYLPDDWEYDINDHGANGWAFYKNVDGVTRRFITMGQEPAFTIPKLKEIIEREYSEELAKKVRLYFPRNTY